MKVLYLLTEMDPIYGGPTYSVPLQCIGVKRHGAEMHMLSFKGNEKYAKDLEKEGVLVEYIAKPGSFWKRKFYTSVLNFFKNNTFYDIYHAHGVWLPCNHWMAFIARKKGISYVVNPRGDLQVKSMSYNKVKQLKKHMAWQLYAKKDINSASCIIATSSQEAQAIRRLGVKAPIAIIPNGIDLSIFPKSVNHQHHKKKIALFLGRINPIKGLDYLIKAWSLLPETIRSNWELHIAGNSDPNDYIFKLKDQVSNLGLENEVIFVGQLTGEIKIKKYSESDLFILPSHNENFSNVVVESLMCECPVITTQGTPWKSLTDNNAGWWIDLSCDNLLKTIIEACSLTDEQRWEKGRRGRKLIENNYSLEMVSEKTMRLYQWIVGKAPIPEYVETK